jgi:inosine/xanthosine triphosphatase
MKKVIIASKNPVKINATKLAFEKIFPDDKFEFVGESAPSGVADQPMTDLETLQGAKNRAKHIMENVEGDYWVGIEGGLEEENGKLEAFAWVFICSKSMEGWSRSATFTLPKEISELVRNGTELGIADDKFSNRVNSKQGNGTVGLVTNDVITRTLYYEQPVILALAPFLHLEWY